jgi:hypothetical protein
VQVARHDSPDLTSFLFLRSPGARGERQENGDATSGFAVCVCDFTGETDGGVACPLTPCTAGSTCDDGATCGAYGTASASACAPSCLEDAAICPSGSHCQEFAP